MYAAIKGLTPILLLAALAGCGGNDADEQNVVITNEVPANADIEALPADESSATPTDELINGADDSNVNGDVNAPDNQTDGY